MRLHCLTELSFCRTEPFSMMSSVTLTLNVFISVKHKRRTFGESTVHTVTRSFQAPTKTFDFILQNLPRSVEKRRTFLEQHVGEEMMAEFYLFFR